MWEGRGGELTRRCWGKINDREKKGRERSEWEKERKEFIEERGVNGETEWDEIDEKVKEMQRKERWERIGGAKYNKWYRVTKGEGIPKYLKSNWNEGRWRRVIRFRVGNEMKEGKYWEDEEKRMCRVYWAEEETWEHVWERRKRGMHERGGWQENVRWVVGEEREGEQCMREVERRRKEGRMGEEKEEWKEEEREEQGKGGMIDGNGSRREYRERVIQKRKGRKEGGSPSPSLPPFPRPFLPPYSPPLSLSLAYIDKA